MGSYKDILTSSSDRRETISLSTSSLFCFASFSAAYEREKCFVLNFSIKGIQNKKSTPSPNCSKLQIVNPHLKIHLLMISE